MPFAMKISTIDAITLAHRCQSLSFLPYFI